MIRIATPGHIHGYLNQIAEPEDLEADWYLAGNYYDLYYEIGKTLKPKSILELGVRYGYSLISMAIGCCEDAQLRIEGLPTLIQLQAPKLYGIDGDIESNAKALGKIRHFFPSTTLILHGTNIESLPSISPAVDLAHLDANHDERIIQELQLVWPIAKYIVIDDVGSTQSYSPLMSMKKQLIDAFLQYRIDNIGDIAGVEYINSYRGTYIIERK